MGFMTAERSKGTAALMTAERGRSAKVELTPIARVAITPPAMPSRRKDEGKARMALQDEDKCQRCGIAKFGT